MLPKTQKTFLNVAQNSTNTVLVTTSAAFCTKVVGLALVCGGTATTISFGSGSTAISATFSLGVNGIMVLPVTEDGWFKTLLGGNLTATTGAGSTIAVQVVFTTDTP